MSAEPSLVRERWNPNRGAQEAFLRSTADEVLYGGAAGGGKTSSLLAAAARFVHVKGYKALLLRRTVPELEGGDGIVDKSFAFYLPLGGTYNSSRRTWRFPAGSRIDFRACELDSDARSFGGWEIQLLCIDELTTFGTPVVYEFLLGRLRTTNPELPCFARTTSNPGGRGEDWVLARWRWWLYRPGERESEFTGPYAKPRSKLWLKRDPATGIDEIVEPHTEGARSRVFIPARLTDNPYLASTDYGARLDGLDPLTRKQLKEGDWMARALPGTFFPRAQVRMLPCAPKGALARVRYWDRAGTEVKRGRDPDWTAGVLMSRLRDGTYVVEHVARIRQEPSGVYAFVEQVARADHGSDSSITQVLEQDPGQAGKADVAALVRQLAGVNVRVALPTGDKVTRAKPFSAQLAAGNVAVVAGPWSLAYLDELESFPLGAHDDQVDASSGAFAALASAATAGYTRSGERATAEWRSVGSVEPRARRW